MKNGRTINTFLSDKMIGLLLWGCLWCPCIALAQGVDIDDSDLDLLESDTEELRVDLVPMDEFDFSFHEFQNLLKKEYATRFPVPQHGDELDVVKPSGIVSSGIYKGVKEGAVQLTQGGRERSISLNELRVNDRIRLDKAFRKTWIEVFARAEARRHFQDEGMQFKTYNMAFRRQYAEALKVSDPSALYRVAIDYREGIRQERDLGYSFLYTSAAAKQAVVEARYDLGRMYYSGMVTSINKNRGLQWISAAAAEGHANAKKFLQFHKVSAESAKAAAEAYRAARAAERAAYEERLARYEEANASRIVIRGKKRGVSFD